MDILNKIFNSFGNIISNEFKINKVELRLSIDISNGIHEQLYFGIVRKWTIQSLIAYEGISHH